MKAAITVIRGRRSPGTGSSARGRNGSPGAAVLVPERVTSGPKNWLARPKLAPWVSTVSPSTSGSRSAGRPGVPSFRTRRTMTCTGPCPVCIVAVPSGTCTTGGSNARPTAFDPSRTRTPTRQVSCVSGGSAANGPSTMSNMSSSVTGWNRSSQWKRICGSQYSASRRTWAFVSGAVSPKLCSAAKPRSP